MGVSERGDVQIAAHLCKGCCLCIAACPPGVLAQSDFLNRHGYYAVSYRGTGCTGCGVCFYVCPEPGALTVRKRAQDSSISPKPGSGPASAEPLPAAN
jgi:NAD-dependent dihydropyrimidine dehydrogenase PreA subunit